MRKLLPFALLAAALCGCCSYEIRKEGGKDVVLVMLNPRAEASTATFNVNVPFKKTKLLMGDKFDVKRDRKTGDVTVNMPGQSYAIIKLQ